MTYTVEYLCNVKEAKSPNSTGVLRSAYASSTLFMHKIVGQIIV